MSAEAPGLREHGNSYNIFILVLTVFSLALMALQLLPLDPETRHLITAYDNVACLIFLIDFAMNLIGSKPKREYFIERRGWLDLLGSIPSSGSSLHRPLPPRPPEPPDPDHAPARRPDRKQLIADLLANRSQYATFVTILLAGLVLTVSSLLVLQQESRSPTRTSRPVGMPCGGPS